jgi:hypothetical protein
LNAGSVEPGVVLRVVGAGLENGFMHTSGDVTLQNSRGEGDWDDGFRRRLVANRGLLFEDLNR